MARTCGSCSTIGRRFASAPGLASTCTRSPPPRRASCAPADELTLFSSSWKDRLAAVASPGARIVDARVPVRLLNSPGTGSAGRPVERFAGPDRHRPLAASAADAGAARRAGRHHPRSRLPRSSGAHARARSGATIAALAPRHAPRADAVVTISRFTAGEVERRLGVAARPHRHLPARRAAPGRRAAAPAPRGPILFMGTLEPRKNVGALLGRTRGCAADGPTAPPLWLAGGATEAAAPWLRAIAEAAARRARRAPRATSRASALRSLRAGVDAGAALALEGFGMTVLEAMTVGVPVDRQPTAARCRRSRATPRS